MMMMKVNYRLSLAIILTTFLHVVGLIFYIFDVIPESWQKFYFYNLDRIYLSALLGLTWLLHIDKQVKTALAVAFLVHLSTSIIINIKYLVNLSSETREQVWVIALALSMITCLISIYYVASRQISK